MIRVYFNKADCHSCPTKADCTRSKTGARGLTLLPEQLHQALFAARKRQTTKEFKKQYAHRAGIEGTISQGTRAFGLRRCRYRGFPKTRLQHIITAAAINLVRVWEWWTKAYTFGTSLTIRRFSPLNIKRRIHRYCWTKRSQSNPTSYKTEKLGKISK